MGGPGGLGGLGGLQFNVSKQFAIKNAGETNSIKHDWLDEIERSSMENSQFRKGKMVFLKSRSP